jgi:hypothetical protein
MNDHFKSIADWIAVVLAGAVAANLLPFLLALPSFIYSCIRIYEWWKGKQHGNIGNK